MNQVSWENQQIFCYSVAKAYEWIVSEINKEQDEYWIENAASIDFCSQLRAQLPLKERLINSVPLLSLIGGSCT